MATIIEFRATRSHDTGPAIGRLEPVRSGTAEIVIFPGIRYEYRDEATSGDVPAAKPKVQRRGKRDVIEID